MIPRDLKQSPKTRPANGAGPDGVFGGRFCDGMCGDGGKLVQLNCVEAGWVYKQDGLGRVDTGHTEIIGRRRWRAGA